MNGTPSQAFRTQFSSKVITIPTRHDPKGKQRVVRWKDILQYFKNAEGIMNGDDAVLFLTDDDLEDLIPLRIAHHPGVVLDVVTTDTSRGDSCNMMNIGSNTVPELGLSSMDNFPARNVSNNDCRMESQSLMASSSGEIVTLGRNTTALRITELDDNQALVVRTQGLLSEISVQGTGEGSADQLRLEMDSTMDLQEQLRQLKQQLEQLNEFQQTMQQTDQQTQNTLQHMQQQADEILQQTQQMHQQTQHFHQQFEQRIEEAVQKIQHMDQQKQLIHEILNSRLVQQYIIEAVQKIQQEDRQQQQQQQQQQIEKISEKTQQIDQQVQHSHQQMQSQIDKILQRILQMDQQTENSQEQMQQQMDQEMHRAFSRFFRVQYQVQSILNMTFQEMPVPRLFIVLPKSTAIVNEQRKACSSQFRLYYLCECGSLSRGKNTSETREIHMRKHSGYDLVNPNEFFDKYGTYLLTIMYMVKYGANAHGRKVPLLDFDLANEAETGQEHLNFIKKNINRLVNDTIHYLEETIGAINEYLGASAYQNLCILDLEQLKSYLQVKNGESVTGDLCRTITQDGNCVWICSEHQLQYYQSTMQQLKKIITASGGWYCEETDELIIKITSDELAKRFYDGMAKVCGIQSTSNVLSPTVLELKLDCYDSLKNPTAGIIAINLSSIHFLSLDFERHSMTTVISQGEVKDVNMKIVRLGDLSLDDFEFIKQCHTVQLEIQHTPQQADEDRLVSILQHIHMLKELHI
ncbi:hypothetical protein BGZ65_003964, partial [Modicella reniformis]